MNKSNENSENRICMAAEYGDNCVRENPDSYMKINPESGNPRLLLHSCCGPCSTSVIERLAPHYRITVFYFNPCITEEEEYIKRRENQKAFIKSFNETSSLEPIGFLEGDYVPAEYFARVKGLEDAPEGGARCRVCFRQRLEETAKTAKDMKMDFFGTTLTVSPHKDYQVISEIGKELAELYEIEFLDMDFKKKAGFQRSIQLSKEYGLYRQDYCGCIFSKRD